MTLHTATLHTATLHTGTRTTTPTAAVWSGIEQGFTVDSLPLPDLRPGELLVEVELATICGSDLHTVSGKRSTPVPTVLGHEAVGTIVAAHGPVHGPDNQPLGHGDRITWTIGTACGTCRRCRRGIPQKCLSVRKYGHEAMDQHWRLNGGLASHCHLLAGTGIVPVPDGLPAEVAAPANCATATVTCAARRVGLDQTDAVVVIGCGMLGLTAAAYTRHLGIEQILACDPNPGRRRLAAQFGATATCAPHELASAARRHGADVVLELSGSPTAVQSALDVVDTGGRVALIGSVFPTLPVQFEPNAHVRNLTTVVGCHNYRTDDLAEAVQFLQDTAARQQLAALVPETFPLTAIEDAIAAARTGRSPRVAVQPPHGARPGARRGAQPAPAARAGRAERG